VSARFYGRVHRQARSFSVRTGLSTETVEEVVHGPSAFQQVGDAKKRVVASLKPLQSPRVTPLSPIDLNQPLFPTSVSPQVIKTFRPIQEEAPLVVIDEPEPEVDPPVGTEIEEEPFPHWKYILFGLVLIGLAYITDE